MNLFDEFCKLTQDIGTFMVKRKPEILAGTAIACFTGATVSAVMVTPKAIKRIDAKKEELKVGKLSVRETVRTASSLYLPSAGLTVLGVVCTCKAIGTANKRIVALSTSYELLRDASTAYRNKFIETYGERKDEKLRDAIGQDKLDQNPPIQNVNIYAPKDNGTYKTLFYEPIMNKYFWERREKVELAIAKIYKEQRGSFEQAISAYTCLSMLSEDLFIGVPEHAIDKLTDIGWAQTNLHDGLEIEIRSGGVVHGGEYDGYPCLRLEYSEDPYANFRSAY